MAETRPDSSSTNGFDVAKASDFQRDFASDAVVDNVYRFTRRV
jgi:hypothetical protein